MVEVPTEKVNEMKKKGLENAEISKKLEEQGYSPQQIDDAITQINIKENITNQPNISSQETRAPDASQLINKGADDLTTQPSSPISGDYQESALDQEEIPIPAPPEEEREVATQRSSQHPQMPYQSTSEELIESIIDEKWQQLVSNLGDIELWKSRVSDDLEAIKQEILRITDRLNSLQTSMVGKVSEYSKSISSINTELRALEKVMQKIMEPLTTNIKELQGITEKLKAK